MHTDTSQLPRSPSGASLVTALTRSDSEGLIPLPLLERPLLPRQPRTPSHPRHSQIPSLPFIILGAIIFLLVAAAALLGSPAVGTPPAARKSAGMAAFSNATGDDLLVVWSGMGHGEVLMDDMLAFNIQAKTWRKIKTHNRKRIKNSGSNSSSRRASPIEATAAADQPEPRWKASVSTIESPTGMLVFGGDGETREGMMYLDDVWALKFPDMRWEPLMASQTEATGDLQAVAASQATAAVGASIGRLHSESIDTRLKGINNNNPGPRVGQRSGPGPRRAHSAVTFTSVSGIESVVVFGGRRANGTLLNDAWLGEIRSTNITWKLLAAGNVESEIKANASNKAKKKKKNKKDDKKIPCPRKGHTAILRENPQSQGAFEMVIYGGRNDLGYLDDLWVLHLKTGTWEEIKLEDRSPMPPPRDHHAAELGTSGQMLVYAGRSGPTYEASQPMGDLWAFDFSARRWSQVFEYGLRPLPRFLFSTARYQKQPSQPMETATGPQLFIFGGETLGGCKLNDVWTLDLEKLRWELMSPNIFAKKRCDRLFGGGGGGRGRQVELLNEN